MPPIFTDYVRSLDPNGAPPDRRSFEELWRALRRSLRREIKSRGLWESSPSFLGVYGWQSWDRRSQAAAPNAGDSALDELLADCYPYIFVERLRHLVAHLKLKPNIDGLVLLNVRNFLHELQKKHDPLGYRVFAIGHAAVAGLIREGQLHVLRGNARVRNDTVLGFDERSDAETLATAPLEPIVRRWNDTLLPDLVTARAAARERVTATLQSYLLRLPEEGLEGFVFKELIDPLKNDVRLRWAARLDFEEGESAVAADADHDVPDVVRLVLPDDSIEERQSFEHLSACVSEGLERLDESEATKSYVASLWDYLRAFAAEPGEKLPSNRKLAGLLRIPRNRMSELYSTLGGVVEDCRKANLSRAAVNPIRGSGTSGGTSMSSWQSRSDALRQRTGEARARIAALESRGSEEAGRSGDLFLLRETADLPVEWAVLRRRDGDPARLLVVPADADPLVGSADIAVSEGADCAPLVLRCAYGLWLDAAAFEPALRTATLPGEDLERARRRQAELEGGETAASPHAREVDADPHYRGWQEDVLEPARQAVGKACVLPFRRPPPEPARRRFRAPPNGLALAASVLLAVSLVLGGGLLRQIGRIAELEARLEKEGVGVREPLVNPPFKTLFPADPVRGEPTPLTLPFGSEVVVLLLNVAEVDRYDHYRLEIRNDSGGEVWSHDKMVKTGSSTLSVAVPAAWLPSGDYVLRLYGQPDGVGDPIAEYKIRVEPATESP